VIKSRHDLGLGSFASIINAIVSSQPFGQPVAENQNMSAGARTQSVRSVAPFLGPTENCLLAEPGLIRYADLSLSPFRLLFESACSAHRVLVSVGQLPMVCVRLRIQK
jgi:hypothetical protein